MMWPFGKLNGHADERHYRVIKGDALLQQLFDAGILPPNCRCCIINADVEGATKMYFECFGDERLLGLLDLTAAFEGVKPIRAVDMEKGDARLAD